MPALHVVCYKTVVGIATNITFIDGHVVARIQIDNDNVDNFIGYISDAEYMYFATRYTDSLPVVACHITLDPLDSMPTSMKYLYVPDKVEEVLVAFEAYLDFSPDKNFTHFKIDSSQLFDDKAFNTAGIFVDNTMLHGERSDLLFSMNLPHVEVYMLNNSLFKHRAAKNAIIYNKLPFLSTLSCTNIELVNLMKFALTYKRYACFQILLKTLGTVAGIIVSTSVLDGDTCSSYCKNINLFTINQIVSTNDFDIARNGIISMIKSVNAHTHGIYYEYIFDILQRYTRSDVPPEILRDIILMAGNSSIAFSNFFSREDTRNLITVYNSGGVAAVRDKFRGDAVMWCTE